FGGEAVAQSIDLAECRLNNDVDVSREPGLAVSAAGKGTDDHVGDAESLEDVQGEAKQFSLFHRSSFARPRAERRHPAIWGATCEWLLRRLVASCGRRRRPFPIAPPAS